MTANSKDPAKEQTLRPVDEKPKIRNTVANATALPPRVWVDEGWGYQVEQSQQLKSSINELEPIEYERTPVGRPQGDDAVVATAATAPDVPKPVIAELAAPSSSTDAAAQSAATLVGLDPLLTTAK